jgi:2,3-dihydroxybenzoate-AMP ligase
MIRDSGRGAGVDGNRLDYLEGAVPYPPEVVAEYMGRGWWRGETYVDVWRRAVAREPDREALVDADRRLSWRELDGLVRGVAGALRRLGVGRRDRVLLQLPNRAEYIVAFYAAQLLGAVPVLAVPRHGAPELETVIRLTEPVAWLFPVRDGRRDFAAVVGHLERGGVLPRLPVAVGGPPPPGALAMEALLAERSAPLPEAVASGPDDVAFIGLTGGATGRSKAVPRTHNSFLFNVRRANPEAGPEDVFCACTPVGHTMANQGPLGGWVLSGGRLVMLATPRADAILEAIEREGVTRIGLVPTQLADLLGHPDRERRDLSSLRRVASTGGRLSPELARRARDFFAARGCVFSGSAYGSTEGPASGHAPDEPLDRFVSSVGRPDQRVDRWVVLDSEERELPPGRVGELAVRGPGVFTGYYRSSEDNARVFTAGGYYRTGDLGYVDDDGYVFVTGRLKDVIQRGGEAIVPTEIEELLAGHPAVAAAAVVAMPDPRLGERACAFVVPRPGARPALADLVVYLQDRGAGPLQWPERLELVDRLPETPAGKLDRPALRADIARRLQGESA